jgi:glutathione synthase/RimK-type ligase-like ATP-grasp enzyme
MRVYVIGGKPAAAMLRSSDTDFRSNFSLGGRAETVPVSELAWDEAEIVRAVCRELPLHYAGVDIMHDNGRAVLNEIEDPVGARMLYINTAIDPARLHAEYLESLTNGK